MQNRVAVAEPRLPEEVRRLGVTVRKNSPDLLMVIHLSSPDGSRDQLYHLQLRHLQVARRAGAARRRRRRPRLRRARLLHAHLARPGPGRGARPDRTAKRRGAARAERPGRLRRARISRRCPGRPPSSSTSRRRAGWSTPTSSRTSSSRPIRTDGSRALRDVARVELGAQDYSANGYLDEQRGGRHC